VGMIRIGPAQVDAAGTAPASEGGTAELFGSVLAGVGAPAVQTRLDSSADQDPTVTLADARLPLPLPGGELLETLAERSSIPVTAGDDGRGRRS
jgi:hypothetical protein